MAAGKVFDSFLSASDHREKHVYQHQLCKDIKPQAVICFDEARALFHPQDQRGPIRGMEFLALRRALHHQSTTSKDIDKRALLALLLGTPVRVSEFPQHRMTQV